MTAAEPEGGVSGATPIPRRWAGRLGRAVVWLLVALLLAVAALVIAAGRPSTLQWAAERIPTLTGGRLVIDGIAGSLFDEISASTVRWRDASVQVTVSAPRMVLHPIALVDRFVRIERISAAAIEVEWPAATADSRPAQPVRLPGDWALMLPGVIERLDIGRVVVRRGGVEQFRLDDLEASLRADADRLTASVQSLDLTVGTARIGLRGDASVLTRAPHATDGRIRLRVPDRSGRPPLRVEIRVNGPVEELSLRANTQWAGAPVEARTVLHALDPRPLRQLRVDVRDLDLSRHDPAWPVTWLTGRYDAEISPAWASERKPLLIGPLTLANAVPGPIDRKRIPVGEAKAVASYADGRITLQNLQASGPPGHSTGEGWFGNGGYRIVATSDALGLAALDSRLARRTLRVRLSMEPDAGGDGLDLDLKASDATLDTELAARFGGDQLRISRAQFRIRPGGAGRAGQASFSGRVGTTAPFALSLAGDFRDFDPAQLLAAVPSGTLNGRWRADGNATERLTGDVTLTGSRLRDLPLAGSLAATVTLKAFQPQRISAARASLRWGATKIDASGALGESADALRLDIEALKLAELQRGASGAVTVRATLRGALLQPSIEADATARRLLASFGGWRAAIDTAAVQLTSARVASGVLRLDARFGGVDLSRLPQQPQPPVRAGRVRASPPSPGLPARNGATAAIRLAELTVRIDGSVGRHQAEIDGRGVDQSIRVQARGGLSDAGLWTGEVERFGVSHPLLALPTGQGAPDPARRDLDSLQPFALTVSAERRSIREAKFAFNGATVNLRQLDWAAPSLALRADATGIAARWIGRFVDVASLYQSGNGVDLIAAKQDLSLAAAITFNGDVADGSAADWTGSLRLMRERGDLALRPPAVAVTEGPIGRSDEPGAGLQRVDLSATIAARVVRVLVDIEGERIGRIAGNAQTTLAATGEPVWAAASLARSPLGGRLNLAMPSFRWISPLIGDNWQVDGALSARLDLAGTLTSPRADGVVTGADLSAQEQTLGMRLRNGVLAAEFSGDRVDVKVLRFESGEGSVAVSGLLQPPGSGRSEANIVVDRLPIPLGIGQRVILSGSTSAALERRTLSVGGRLVADEGVIELKGGDAPSVSSDVVIVDADGRARPIRNGAANGRGDDSAPGLRTTEVAARLPPRDAPATGARGATGAPGAFRIATDVELDLGRRFRVFGSGVEAKLQGAIRLTGTVPEAPRASGTVEIVDGTYQIYGRKLKIKRGRVIFNGPLDNPALDIVAIREFLKVEPGVEISGTAVSPVVKLTSDPEVPDADKLSWLVLGTGIEDAQGAGQMFALQAAATTLFGDEDSKYSGGLTERLGIDLLSVRDQTVPSTTVGGGSENSQGAVVTVGKRLSSRLFVTYEQSLRGVWNILKLQYEITNRLSLSVQAGSDSAVDLLWFFPFD